MPVGVRRDNRRTCRCVRSLFFFFSTSAAVAAFRPASVTSWSTVIRRRVHGRHSNGRFNNHKTRRDESVWLRGKCIKNTGTKRAIQIVEKKKSPIERQSRYVGCTVRAGRPSEREWRRVQRFVTIRRPFRRISCTPSVRNFSLSLFLVFFFFFFNWADPWYSCVRLSRFNASKPEKRTGGLQNTRTAATTTPVGCRLTPYSTCFLHEKIWTDGLVIVQCVYLPTPPSPRWLSTNFAHYPCPSSAPLLVPYLLPSISATKLNVKCQCVWSFRVSYSLYVVCRIYFYCVCRCLCIYKRACVCVCACVR